MSSPQTAPDAGYVLIPPPFDEAGARAVVQAAEDAWNARDPEAIPDGYTEDTRWRYRDRFVVGRGGILPFLREAWPRQKDYRLRKELWSFTGNRISVRFVSEWRHADTGQCYRTFGCEHWEFAPDGRCSILELSANDLAIADADRQL